MDQYNQLVKVELESWQRKMLRHPSLVNKLSKKVQDKINGFIPEKIHKGITIAIKQMVRGVLFGAKITTTQHAPHQSIEVVEARVSERIDFYKKTAAAEGGVTGAGGFLLALADFPLLLTLKMKMLFEIASLYGFDITDYKERVYLLHIFQLAFSSHKKQEKYICKLKIGTRRSNNFQLILMNMTGDHFNKNTETILTLQNWHN